MCDNIVALGNVTANGAVLFAKNSDREPNEPHYVTIVPHAVHPKGSKLRCTYIDIPQVAETNRVLLCKPSWLWGAEMGSNEHGLTIGNTAVFTREPYETQPGLIGMDFLRLALERTATAPAALETITTLLETYGQSGSNGFAHEFYYHNSFLIADPREAWVLETIGRRWAARKVVDIAGTSNTLTLTTEWDLASDDLIEYAHKKGWANKKGDFNIKESYSGAGFYTSYIYDRFGHGDERYQRLTSLLSDRRGAIDEAVMIEALRDHGASAGANYSPAKGLNQNPPCMHAGAGPIRASQTTGSLVSHLAVDSQTHWITATSAPCTAIFKPVWLDLDLPDMGQVPTGHYNHAALWWRHERLHRRTLMDYQTMRAVYRDERDEMEARFIQQAQLVLDSPPAGRAAFGETCFAESDEALDRWTQAVNTTEPLHKIPGHYRKIWHKLTEQAGYNFGFREKFTSSPTD